MALDKYDEDFTRLQAARAQLNAINLRTYRGEPDFREAVKTARLSADTAHDALIEVEQRAEAALEEEGGDG